MATGPVKALVKNAGWQIVTSWNPHGVFTVTNKFFQTSSIEKIKIFGNCDKYLSRGITNMSQKMLLFSKYSIKCIKSIGKVVIDRIRKKAMNYQFPGFIRSGFLMPAKPPDKKEPDEPNKVVMQQLKLRYSKQITKSTNSLISEDEFESCTESEGEEEEMTAEDLLEVPQSRLLEILETKPHSFVRNFLQLSISRRRIVPLSELHIKIKQIMLAAPQQEQVEVKSTAVTPKSPPVPHEVRTVLGLITEPKMLLCLHYPNNKNVKEYLDILLTTTNTVYQDCDREKHIQAFDRMNKAHYFHIFRDKLEEVSAYLGLRDYRRKMGFSDEMVEKLDEIKTEPERLKEKELATYRRQVYGKDSAEYERVLKDHVELKAKKDPKSIVTDAKLKVMEGRRKPTYEESKIARLHRNAKLQGYTGDMDLYVAKNKNILD